LHNTCSSIGPGGHFQLWTQSEFSIEQLFLKSALIDWTIYPIYNYEQIFKYSD